MHFARNESFKKHKTKLFLIGIILVNILIAFLIHQYADAYIATRYTVPQIVNESSNIVFGTIEEVNTKRKTANIKVEHNIKGRSEFDVIRIRFDIYKGEADHRGEIARFLKKDEQIIVCYLQEDGRIDALAHTRGKWFQLQLTKDKERGWGRWGFTHFEKYLNQDKVSRRNSTKDFQKELRSLLDGKMIDFLLLNRKGYEDELNFISDMNRIGNQYLACKQTTDRDLDRLNDFDILWLGYRAIDDGKYRLSKDQEKRIRDYVKSGGVVIVSGQDSDQNRPCGVGWLSEPLKGVESNIRNDFQPTSNAGNLFKAPNQIRSGKLVLDDSWNGWNDKFEVLATTNNGKEIVVAKLRYGKGMYLITNLRNDNKQNTNKNRQLLENLIHYTVDFLN